jgi:hypothetical protein
MFELLLHSWRMKSKGVTFPPRQLIMLWSDNRGGIAIGDTWGPPVPYPPADHEDGNRNHGYVRIKGDAEAARQIPEAVGWPELQELLIAINADDSPIESVGCEKTYAPVNVPNGPRAQLGSYINLMFSELSLNAVPENALLLASELFAAVEGCERWWSTIEIEVERFKAMPGVAAPWGLLVRLNAAGRDQSEARRGWGETLKRVATAVRKLPVDFKWQDTTGSQKKAL